MNKHDGQTEFILLDSENRPVLDLRTESLLNAFTNEPGLKALLRDEISAIDLLIQCFTGKADMASIIADSLVGTPFAPLLAPNPFFCFATWTVALTRLPCAGAFGVELEVLTRARRS